jgi:MerR family transcriptional regulator, thiopeptide resistance regulator
VLWSIVDVARSAGVTARTLRHWDAIGLLPPTAIGGDGYRRYDERALLRLQRVLVLRTLGLPLRDIGAVLDAEQDELATLREHHRRLLAERERLTRIAATVERTVRELERLERNETMTIDHPEDLFDGFDEHAYAEEARQRWPEQAAQSEARTAAMTDADKVRLQQEHEAEQQRMAALLTAGVPVTAPEVQQEIAGLHRRVSAMWTPDAASFSGLGAVYVDDDRFRRVYDTVAPGLAEYYRDAMAHFARERLE